MIVTKCKKCIFAETEDSQQTGCSLNIPSYILENYPDIYKSEQIKIVDGFYQINDFCCSSARTKEWLSIVEENGLSCIEQLKNEIKIKYLLLLIVENTDNLWSNLNTALSCEHKPSFISIVCRNLAEQQIKDIIDYMENNSKIQWKLNNILDIEMTTSEAIDLALTNNLQSDKCDILCIMNNNKLLTDSFFNTSSSILNSFVNKMVSILTDDPMCFDRIIIPISLFISMNNSIGIVLDYLYHDSKDVYKFSVIE